MKNGRPQCKDIPDRTMLSIIETLAVTPYPGLNFRLPRLRRWVFVSEVQRQLGLLGYRGVPDGPEAPDNLVRAKAASLIRRRLLDGCPCGCRGDFEVTDSGRALLELEQSMHVV